MRRRRLLAAGLVGLGTGLALSGCGDGPDHPGDTEFRSPHVTDASAARNVRDFGAVGDGNADDTAALARAAATGGKPLVLYLPAGTYKVSGFPALPDFSTVLGDGSDLTLLHYEQRDTLIRLGDRQRVAFKRLGMYVSDPSATAVHLSRCFRCSFDTVVIRGNLLSTNYPRYTGQRGVVLDENTGGTAFVNCDINNFGVGLTTSCIQNYLTSSKLTNNYVSVLGTGNNHSSGLALTNVEFVSDNDLRTTSRHVVVDGATNDWWLTNIWFEGADIALQIGHRDNGGPAQFGLVNCKIAARRVNLELISCRQAYLANVQFDPDPNHEPTELHIDPDGCPEGTAVNLISGSRFDIDQAVFPRSWSVTGRGYVRTPALLGTVVARSTGGTIDLMQAQSSDGHTMAAVLPSGAWLSDRPEAGVILRAADGGYWRLTVASDGALRTVGLGKLRPLE
ncbi:MAG: mannuronan epimerase [Mycobacteriaceae bacterium]|nr:mannuronan epimerase [Mycobacteriaceae bacterium]